MTCDGKQTPKSTPWYRTLRGREAITFHLFITLWIIGFLLFTVGPIIASLGLSFTDYDIMLPPALVGLGNYQEILDDPLFYTSLYNTVYIVVLAVPLSMMAAFGLAMLLNQKVRMMAAYRTAYFIPSIVPAVVGAALWLYLLQPQWGLVNGFLESIGIPGPGWLSSEVVKAGDYYDFDLGDGRDDDHLSCRFAGYPGLSVRGGGIDGANDRHKFRRITLPLMRRSSSSRWCWASSAPFRYSPRFLS